MSHRILLAKILKHEGNQAYFHTKGQRSHNIQAMEATILDSPDIRSQPQSQACKKHQKNSKDLSLSAFIFDVFEMFQAFWLLMRVICGFMMCSTAPRCSTSSPTSLLFVVSSAVHFATSEPQNSETPGMSRTPRLRTLTLAALASHHPRISWFVSCQPKGRSNFCSVARLQWFTLITKSSTKTDWIWHFYFQNTLGTCKKRRNSMNISEKIFMKIHELWNS